LQPQRGVEASLGKKAVQSLLQEHVNLILKENGM